MDTMDWKRLQELQEIFVYFHGQVLVDDILYNCYNINDIKRFRKYFLEV